MFNPDWEFEYFFTMYNNAPHCMLCFRKLAVARCYNLQRHYNTLHKEYEKYTGHEREILAKNMKTIFVESLKDAAANAATYTSGGKRAKVEDPEECKRKASYVLALSLAKEGRPLTEGQFFKDLLTSVVDCFGEEFHDLKETIQGSSLSGNVLKQHTGVIGAYIKTKIKQTLNECKAFSIFLDEWLDPNSTSQLMICVRTVNDCFEVSEALFALEDFEGEANGKNIYIRLDVALFSWVNMSKLASICTNDALVMTDPETGFVAELKKKNINIPVFHCKIQQQVLFAKTLKIADTVQIVTNTLNELREQPQTQGKLKKFLNELDSEYKDVLLYSETRWIDCENSFEKLFNLRTEIATSLKQEDADDNSKQSQLLAKSLKEPSFLIILAFLTDITKYINILNNSLQGNNKFIFDLVRAIDEFGRKLSLLHKQLNEGNLAHFSSMKKIYDEFEGSIDLKQFDDIFKALIADYNARFLDIDKIRANIEIYENSLSCCLERFDELVQDDLINMRSDLTLPLTNGIDFWQNVSARLYPNVMQIIYQLFSMFATTTTCVGCFSALKLIQNQQRDQLTQKNLTDLLSIKCFKEDIDVDEVINAKGLLVPL